MFQASAKFPWFHFLTAVVLQKSHVPMFCSSDSGLLILSSLFVILLCRWPRLPHRLGMFPFPLEHPSGCHWVWHGSLHPPVDDRILLSCLGRTLPLAWRLDVCCQLGHPVSYSQFLASPSFSGCYDYKDSCQAWGLSLKNGFMRGSCMRWSNSC